LGRDRAVGSLRPTPVELQRALLANVSDSADINARTAVETARSAFDSGRTRDLHWREAQLDGLVAMLEKEERTLLDAMHEDLGKPRFEGWATDIGVLVTEFEHIRKRLPRYLRADRVKVPLFMQPSRAEIHLEPLGVVLILSPWNYPVNLALSPLAAAVAAGNAAVVKPSEISGFTSSALADLLPRYVDDEAIQVVTGGPDAAESLLAQRFDHIVFTGSPRIGSSVMKAAADTLTPVTLELGGKSPVIIDDAAQLEVAARRVALGKLLNAGQTCIAPDYVLATERTRDRFVDHLIDAIDAMLGNDPERSVEYGRIVSDRHWNRLVDLIPDDGIVAGGSGDQATRYLQPTVVLDPDPDSRLMTEEIFGPILPIVTVRDLDEAISFVEQRPKPLVLYLFTEDDDVVDRVNHSLSSGALSVNQTMFHAAIPELPFGGVGNSGMGRYRGLTGIRTLSNPKSVLRAKTSPDLGAAYPPRGRIAQRVMRRFL
jgi:aldehyde dehydrogenase (NAD+)